MTAPADNAINDNIGNNDWLSALASRVYRCLSRSNDRLYNPNDLGQSIIYASLILSLVVPSACFVVFVYPATMDNAMSEAQLASIPILTQQVAQLDKMYQSASATLTELEADPLLASLDDATLQHNDIDLHRMAHHHQIKIVATSTINDNQVSPQFTEHFSATHYSWHLRGRFADYLRFKKALWELSHLMQMQREHLSTREELQLDIFIDLSVYQPKEGGL